MARLTMPEKSKFEGLMVLIWEVKHGPSQFLLEVLEKSLHVSSRSGSCRA